MSKYKSKKTEVDGIVFDSKREAQRYLELKELERLGTIKNLTLQPRFELQPSFKKGGETFRAITYKADFSYITKDGRFVVEDVKSRFTAKDKVFRLKKKLFEYQFPELSLVEYIAENRKRVDIKKTK